MCSQMTFIKELRPAKDNVELLKEAIDEIFPEISLWFRGSSGCVPKDEEIPEIKEEILEALDSSFPDGYKICSKLERKNYWEPDTDLVNILDNFDVKIDGLYSKKVKQWIVDNDIKPKFSIGDKIKFKFNNVLMDGEISRIDMNSAKYTIFCEKLGHVKTGYGITGMIKEFEIVEGFNKDE